jgi:CMP-2-keto-3-deoxyoctulosonic acid synthetase
VTLSEGSNVPVVGSRVLLNIERFEIGQSHVTAKVQNRYNDNVIINIQGSRPGIELQETLFEIKSQQDEKREVRDRLRYAYLVTELIQTNKIFLSYRS